ncbi:dipeptide ABC transporter ATP-binding protein [Thorsellia anophelis]|uniref:Dipeptide transport system ATP-binding protein n=1 Tax=Thorsellia anophelis DSM 18579 TaxID=1123402 RepID=A0A1H9ZDE8_9GAMM|nr:dipeptide ABC transporter ATP-binding protein [Thorsellia anophelis]SES79597.1 dipeptide transport system ATP-binding protein [Thorsellia anophelis DSM 18579]
MTDKTTPLVVKNLTKHYAGSGHWLTGSFFSKKGQGAIKALNGLDFTLNKGETLAVVGESGCGKSTLARQLTLLEKPTSGEVIINGQSTHNLRRDELKSLRSKVQMVFQNPYASLNPRAKVSTQLEEPLRINTALSSAERREQVTEMMQKVGLRPEFAERYPHMFSGGQRQRIAIARAMMLNPEIVIADEPTSALDVSIQAQVLNLFMDLQDVFNTSYIFISHNLSVVEHIATNVLVMYLGRAVEISDKKTLYQTPLHPYTKALLSATPMVYPEDRRATIEITGELPSPLNLPKGCVFHQRCPFATDKCKEVVPELRHIGSSKVACHHAETLN